MSCDIRKKPIVRCEYVICLNIKCFPLFSNLELEVEEARNEEERIMIEDAISWLNQKRIDEVLDWQGTLFQRNFILTSFRI